MNALGPECLRALAMVLRRGNGIRAALIDWHHAVPPEAVPPIRQVSRRLLLGDRVDRAVATLASVMGDDAARLATIAVLGAELGGDCASMIDGLATSIEARNQQTASGRASAAGARMSSRLVAGLPLAFVPLTPTARAPLFDPLGCILLVTGVALATCGMWWIDRAMPRPPPVDDPVTSTAQMLATLADGGIPIAVALGRMARSVRADPALTAAERLVRLGATWSQALERVGGPWAELAATIRRSEDGGTPISVSLRGLARQRREELQAAFDAATRRAPVVMVVPLALCVLPSFCLLALAPFLRGLALGP